MYTLRITLHDGDQLVELRERRVTGWERAKKAFYNATYNNPGARVTLANAEGKVIRIGSHSKTEYSSNED